MGKVLFSTLYESKSIIKSSMTVNPTKIVLFVDAELKDKQKESLNFINETFKDQNIEIVQEVLDIFDSVSIAKKLKTLVNKHINDEIYFDVSSSPKPQTLSILYYLTIERPKNLKDVFYYFYNSNENHFIKIPLFEIERLSEKEFSVIKELSKNINLLQKEISEKIDSTEGYTSKLIERLINSEYLIKENKGFVLTEKSKIYLEAIDN
ncbi:MAG: hypothetical protein KC550_01040 [Nanoarchaeota archaeon]|nr:hypothetical protein [Nanoarchaeota archaeon]